MSTATVKYRSPTTPARSQVDLLREEMGSTKNKEWAWLVKTLLQQLVTEKWQATHVDFDRKRVAFLSDSLRWISVEYLGTVPAGQFRKRMSPLWLKSREGNWNYSDMAGMLSFLRIEPLSLFSFCHDADEVVAEFIHTEQNKKYVIKYYPRGKDKLPAMFRTNTIDINGLAGNCVAELPDDDGIGIPDNMSRLTAAIEIDATFRQEEDLL